MHACGPSSSPPTPSLPSTLRHTLERVPLRRRPPAPPVGAIDATRGDATRLDGRRALPREGALTGNTVARLQDVTCARVQRVGGDWTSAVVRGRGAPGGSKVGARRRRKPGLWGSASENRPGGFGSASWHLAILFFFSPESHVRAALAGSHPLMHHY
jgi:hypothetical protein